MTDRQLRRDIVDELTFEPSMDASDIGVAVDAAVVTLTGHVGSYGEKLTAIEITENVRGVRAVVDEIEVRPAGHHVLPDDELARRIVAALQWTSSVPDDRIHVRVQAGRVILSGAVEWRYQVEAAERTVRGMGGVTGVENAIEVSPVVNVADVAERIRKALLRDAELDASEIRVLAENGTITLEGIVRHPDERRAAERAAWSAAGVNKVVDRLTVR